MKHIATISVTCEHNGYAVWTEQEEAWTLLGVYPDMRNAMNAAKLFAQAHGATMGFTNFEVN